MNLNPPFQDISKAAQALKDVLEADEQTIQKLPPLERLLARQIRRELRANRGVSQ